MKDLSAEEQITKEAYDKHGKAWASAHLMDGFWDKEYKKFHKLIPKGSVIDIGCGGGRDAKNLIKMGYTYIGTDISDTFLKFCRKRIPNHIFLRQSVYELKFPKKFDAFWACAVLLHVPRKRMDEALQRVKSVAKPGAIGFISLKDGDGEYITNDFVAGRDLERFFSYWKKDEFVSVLERNGFSLVEYHFKPMTEQTKWHCFFVKNDLNSNG